MKTATNTPQVQGRKKLRVGIVIKDKMNQTRIVETMRTVRHPFYEKTTQVRKRLMSHDARNESKVGDRVVVQESRPLSRHKRWTLVKILERAQAAK